MKDPWWFMIMTRGGEEASAPHPAQTTPKWRGDLWGEASADRRNLDSSLDSSPTSAGGLTNSISVWWRRSPVHVGQEGSSASVEQPCRPNGSQRGSSRTDPAHPDHTPADSFCFEMSEQKTKRDKQQECISMHRCVKLHEAEWKIQTFNYYSSIDILALMHAEYGTVQCSMVCQKEFNELHEREEVNLYHPSSLLSLTSEPATTFFAVKSTSLHIDSSFFCPWTPSL